MKNAEIFFKNRLLKFLLISAKQNQNLPLPEITRQTKVLFIRLNRIGDALVTTPLITAIKEKTGCIIDILADEKNYFVFRNHPAHRKLFVYEKGVKPTRELIARLNQENYDIIVDTHDDVSFTVSLLCRLIQSPYKFALQKENAGLFSHTIEKPNPETMHVVERVLKMSTLFGFEADTETARVVYEPEEESKQKVKDFFHSRFPESKFIVGVNISAGSEARFWGTDKYRKLILELKKDNFDVVLLATTRDLKHAFRITDERDKIFYTPKFDEFVAVMQHLNILFSPDTSTVHLASIYSVPVFGLYVKYNTNDMIWSPYGSKFDGIITNAPTLMGIPFDEVYSKFREFLRLNSVTV